MKYSRELTFTEKKVNFNHINKMWVWLSNILSDKLLKFLPILAQKKANDKIINQIVNIVTLIQKEAFEIWKKSASSEMKIKTSKTNSKIINIMKKNNKKIITKIINDINLNLISKWFSEKWIVKQFLNWLKTLFVYWSINMWREVVFEQNPEQIYAFQYSAILDWATTDLCRSLDWLIINPTDPRRNKFNPPNHWNCRSIWVEILIDEKYKPKLLIKEWNDSKWIMKQYKNVNSDLWLQETKDLIIKEEKKDNIYWKNLKIKKQYLDDYKELADRIIAKWRIESLKKNLTEDFNWLNDYELIALNKYTSEFININNTLRWYDYVWNEDYKWINLWLIPYIINWLNKLPNYKWYVSRWISLDNEEIHNLIKKLNIWDIYEDNAFLSTSIWKEVKKDFKGWVEFLIKSKTWKRIEKISNYWSREQEVLFNPNTKFKILSKEYKEWIYYIEMKEIDYQEYKEQINIANQLWQIYDKQLEERRKSYKKVESKK